VVSEHAFNPRRLWYIPSPPGFFPASLGIWKSWSAALGGEVCIVHASRLHDGVGTIASGSGAMATQIVPPAVLLSVARLYNFCIVQVRPETITVSDSPLQMSPISRPEESREI
jgi:X-X-X-Leu-X-X-Gly heptad repeat protein